MNTRLGTQVMYTQTKNQKDIYMKTAVIFFFAVLSEVIATSALKFSEGFTKLVPSAIVVVGYGISFYLLSLSLKVIPIGTAYALWSGIGIVLTVIAGIVIWRETMDWARGIGIFFIILGIIIINLFSRSAVN
jgi:small multidrug resistance pump